MAGPNVEKNKTPLIAKKDWHILCGGWDVKTGKHEFDYPIKKGQDVSGLPKWAIETLKIENVI